MYFSKIPNVEYDQKPLSFPISEKQYVLAKNFFRRTNFKDTVFDSLVYFNKYTITDDDRLDLISQKFYGTPEYDWVILLTNNIINTNFNLPVPDSKLYDFVDSEYKYSEYDPDESSLMPADRTHHYETYELKNSLGETILKAGLVVDKRYYNTVHRFYDRGTKGYINKQGKDLCFKVSNYLHEKNINNSKREIYILKNVYLERFVSQFENVTEYTDSNSYIDSKTKRSGI